MQLRGLKRLPSSRRSVQPCHNFYRFVCDGWDKSHERSVTDNVYAGFKENAIHHVRRTHVPQTRQSAVQKAAGLFQSCESVLASERGEIEALKHVLRGAGIDWPHPGEPSQFNALRSLLLLSCQWGWDAVFKLSHNHYRHMVTLKPSWSFGNMLDRRDAIISSTKYRDYFNTIYEAFGGNNASSATFNVIAAVENTILGPLKLAYSASAETVRAQTPDEMARYTPSMNASMWVRTSHDCEKDTHLETFETIEIENPTFLAAFSILPELVGEVNASLYVGWIVAQYTSPIGSAELATNYAGSVQGGREWHQEYCFNVTYDSMGFAFLAGFLGELISTKVRMDVTNIVIHIRETLQASLGNSDIWKSLYAPGMIFETGQLELVDRFKPDVVENVYAAFPEMSTAYLPNLRAAVRAFKRGNPRRLSVPSSGIDIHVDETAIIEDGTPQTISLKPSMFSMPFYDVEAPSSIKYATLGYQGMLGYTFGFIARSLQSHKAQVKKVMKSLIDCLRPAIGESVDNADFLILFAIALRSSWEALQSVATKDTGSESPEREMTELSSLSESKLFFVYWCYVTCRGQQGRGRGREYCNQVLRTMDVFAKAFECKSGSDMVINKYCPLM